MVSSVALATEKHVQGCYNLQDLLNTECSTACHREGYKQGGTFVRVKSDLFCVCHQSFPYARITRKDGKISQFEWDISPGNGEDMNFSASQWQSPKGD